MLKNKMLFSSLLMLIFVLYPGFSFSLEKPIHRVVFKEAGMLIKDLAEEPVSSVRLTNGGEPLYEMIMLSRFYRNRNYMPAWSGDESSFPHSADLMEAIQDVDLEGLVPEDYHMRSILALYEQLQSQKVLAPEVVAELDLLLTDSFLMIGCRFSASCADPVTVETEWLASRRGLNMDFLLEDALKENTIRDTLQSLLPVQKEYAYLRRNLVRHKGIAQGGGWPVVKVNSTLNKGDRSHLVNILRERLVKSGDLLRGAGDKMYFNEELEQAVIRFQKRHGIKADGIVGADTLKEMNVPAQKRIWQMELNLERMRWSARNLGHRYLLVNIADFRLEVLDYGERLLTMEVVVGKPFWNTPIFSDKLTYLVLNPSWKIPESITSEEIIPAERSNPGYIKNRNIRIYRSWAENSQEIDPGTIQWSEVDADNFSYKLIQSPGAFNPLGKIKFMLPNKYNIYIHDSPAKGLFSRTTRAFSHGCIRVKDPLALAEYLLRDHPDWGREEVLRAINEGEEFKVDLKYPITVHILYLTAWVDEKETLHFRNDVYGRDEKLDDALRKKMDLRLISANH